MNKQYKKPTIVIVKLQHQSMIAESGGMTGPNGSRQYRSNWDDKE